MFLVGFRSFNLTNLMRAVVGYVIGVNKTKTSPHYYRGKCSFSELRHITLYAGQNNRCFVLTPFLSKARNMFSM